MEIDPASARSIVLPTDTGEEYLLSQGLVFAFKKIHRNCQFYRHIRSRVVFEHPR
jgi:hypothetical protein